MRQIAVIGGGAAGMMAAVAAADAGAHVILLEKNEKLGKKVYITGKGRCNLTNDCDHKEFFRAVISNPKFLYSSFDAFDNADMIRWIESEGLRIKHERGGRVFPQSDKASDVIRTLQKAMERRGVIVRLNTQVKELITDKTNNEETDTVASGLRLRGEIENPKKDTKERKKCLGVRLASGEIIETDAVIVATGGLSYPSTGSTGDGFRWARKAGLEVKDCRPSLVAFKACFSDRSPVAGLAGLTLKNVGVKIRQANKTVFSEQGEMMFTHTGVSGPLILTASCTVKIKDDEEADLLIDWKPALSLEQLDARLLREFDSHKNKEIKNVCGALLPAAAVAPFLTASGIPHEKPVHDISRQDRRRLAETLKAFPLTLTGHCGYNEAVITQGGICVKEIHPATMESKKIQGLYFAGEVIDLDAVTGGYNLQIAWTTGSAAGRAAASER